MSTPADIMPPTAQTTHGQILEGAVINALIRQCPPGCTLPDGERFNKMLREQVLREITSYDFTGLALRIEHWPTDMAGLYYLAIVQKIADDAVAATIRLYSAS